LIDFSSHAGHVGSVQILTVTGLLSPVMKSSATITTFKAHLKTELFAAAYDTV